ncbi:MAG: D-alanine--D-alanine ligase [Cyanobacteria bacterium J06600_6]
MTTFSPIVKDRQKSLTNIAPLSVLHLVGSAVSDFYFQLSTLYASEVVQPQNVNSSYVVVHPDGMWQLGSSLDNLGQKISLAQALSQLPQADVVVPHMFCFPGMTSYRALFEDILGIPVVGSRSDCNSLITNKSHTRDIVEAAGVRVAQAQLLTKGDALTIKPPFVVKPNSEDNSTGITLVRNEAEIELALESGFKYDDTLLIEAYIPGRELRVGVIEQDNELHVLPPMEYLLTEKQPIRTLDDKLGTQNNGSLIRQPVNVTCPANITPELKQKLAQAVKIAHSSLGNRDYSLYDFRIHSDTQEPYMLESCSFWSFIDASVLSKMLSAEGHQLEAVATKIWRNAASRNRVACGSLFKYVNAGDKDISRIAAQN